MSVCSRSNWNLEMLVFWERGKLEYLEKNVLEQRREPTINSSHMVSMQRLQHGPQRWGGGGECSHHCRSLAPQVLSWVWMLLHYTFTCYDLYALLVYDLRSLHMVSISSCFSVTMDAELHICWSVFVFLHLSVNSWEIYMQTQWMSFCLVNGNWK